MSPSLRPELLLIIRRTQKLTPSTFPSEGVMSESHQSGGPNKTELSILSRSMKATDTEEVKTESTIHILWPDLALRTTSTVTMAQRMEGLNQVPDPVFVASVSRRESSGR